MQSIHLKGKVGGFLLALSVMLGIALASGTTAQAQYRNDQGGQNRGDRDWRRNRNRDRDRDRDRDRRDDRYGRNGQYGNNGGYGGYGNNGGYNNGYRIEQDQGYQAGLNTGTSDAQRGQSYNPQRSHYYKNASSQAFRQGFLQGYDQGFRQYGGYNNDGRYRRRSNIGNILGGILGRP
jgi:hypothetical protein